MTYIKPRETTDYKSNHNIYIKLSLDSTEAASVVVPLQYTHSNEDSVLLIEWVAQTGRRQKITLIIAFAAP